jgi:hypothetical protein
MCPDTICGHNSIPQKRHGLCPILVPCDEEVTENPLNPHLLSQKPPTVFTILSRLLHVSASVMVNDRGDLLTHLQQGILSGNYQAWLLPKRKYKFSSYLQFSAVTVEQICSAPHRKH